MRQTGRCLALAFLNKYEPKGRGKEATWEPARADYGDVLPGFVRSESVEIIPPAKTSSTSLVASARAPAPLALPLPPPPADIAPELDAVVRRFSGLLHHGMETFDLGQSEGLLDAVFDRPDHRLSVKIARSGRALELFENFGKTLEAALLADEKIRLLNRTRQQEYVEQLRLMRTALEEYYSVQHASAAAERREEIEAAKARAEIATYQARAAEALRPAAPELLLPPPVDETARIREEARRKRRAELELGLDEVDERASAAGEKVARAKGRCIEIYQDVAMREGEKHARIQHLLDEYGFDCSILPVGIEDLMIRGYEEVPQ